MEPVKPDTGITPIRLWAYTGTGNLSSILMWYPPSLRKYRYILDENCPELIIINSVSGNDFGGGYFEVAVKRIFHVRRRHGWKPVLLLGEGEYLSPPAGVDFSFSFKPSTKTNCLFATTIRSDKFEFLSANRRNEHEQLCKWRKTQKTQFCNFIYQNELGPETIMRRDFCKLLAQYKPVACPSKSMNNMPRLGQGETKKMDFMAKYKFTIAFENRRSDNYLTEKIFHALCVNSIPVYWGCPQVADYYNPAAFINCHDYKSFADVVEWVKEVDNNPELYQQYLDAPPVLPTSRFHSMLKETARHAEAIIDTVLERRKRKNSRLKSLLCLTRLIQAHGSLLSLLFIKKIKYIFSINK